MSTDSHEGEPPGTERKPPGWPDMRNEVRYRDPTQQAPQAPPQAFPTPPGYGQQAPPPPMRRDPGVPVYVWVGIGVWVGLVVVAFVILLMR